MPRLLVLGDSLTFHGPERAEVLTDPRLFPQVAAAGLTRRTGQPWEADVVARLGWTARDGWWALTKDPQLATVLAPRADAVVLALGQMDQLPAAVPTYLREGIAYVRPGGLRRRVRSGYHALAPHVMRATRGALRQLPQPATDHYLARILQALRLLTRPDLPVVLLGPSPWAGRLYPVHRTHVPAVVAARRWSAQQGVPLVELDPIVTPALRAGTGNPDGLHWGWPTHRQIGEAVAAAVSPALSPALSPAISLAAQPSSRDTLSPVITPDGLLLPRPR